MRIRTQFIITVILFAVMTAIIATSAVITSQRGEKARQQEKIANSVAQGASELRFLSNDYLIYREPQQLARWQARFESFSTDVESLDRQTPGQQALANNILSNQTRMKEVFDSVVAMGQGSAAEPIALDPAVLQVAWSRMAVQSQSLISDASLLARQMEDEADRFGRVNTFVIFSMIAAFGAFFLASFFLIQRRTLSALGKLRAGASVIGSGNLDFVIEERERNDEIGDLSCAFNRMTSELKGVTASKAELEREIAGRGEAEKRVQKVLKSLETSNAELQQFAYVASHDLKEPLRTVSSYMQLLKKRYADKIDSDANDFIDFSVDATHRMGGMIDDLLAYSRVGTHGREFKNVKIAEALNEAIKNLELTIGQRQAEIRAGDLPAVHGDRSQLIILFQNLLANGIKFTRDKRPEIDITAEKTDGMWQFSVRDAGIGIDPKYQDRIFVIFQRLHNREEYPGTGIGLAVCKKIVERHGGRIWFESEPGRGSTFFFTLPEAR